MSLQWFQGQHRLGQPNRGAEQTYIVCFFNYTVPTLHRQHIAADTISDMISYYFYVESLCPAVPDYFVERGEVR